MCPVKMTPWEHHLGAVQRHNYLRLCEHIRRGGHVSFISCHLQRIGNATCSAVLMKILRPDSSSVAIIVHHSCWERREGELEPIFATGDSKSKGGIFSLRNTSATVPEVGSVAASWEGAR